MEATNARGGHSYSHYNTTASMGVTSPCIKHLSIFIWPLSLSRYMRHFAQFAIAIMTLFYFSGLMLSLCTELPKRPRLKVIYCV